MQLRLTIKHAPLGLAIVALVAGLGAQAQTPDAGSSLESFKQSPQPLPPGPRLQPPVTAVVPLVADGKTLKVLGLSFEGNTRLSAAALMAAVGGDTVLGQSLDMARLRELAERVSDFYRAQGYPFARAFLPQQDLRDGVLRIQVVEGRYGEIKVGSDDPAMQAGAPPFLQSLERGAVIEGAALERSVLLLNDLPGVKVTPVVRPGANPGEGDLELIAQQAQRAQANLSLDNHGSRFSGAWRLQSQVSLNRLAVFGDQLSVTAMDPSQDLWVGSINYALPLGAQGLRVQLGKARTRYQLSKGFEGFDGTASVNSLSLSYPLLRSQAKNIGLSLGYQDKDLVDNRLGTAESKNVHVMPLTLSFDQRDNFLLGGVNYGVVSVVNGDIRSASGKQNFTRWNLDVARQQRLSERVSLYGHLQAQKANANLDSSEGLSLGGATGVRAYPSGESSGDEGWLMQFELRASFDAVSPYVFYDQGKIRVDANPELVDSPAPDQQRAGAGLGIRYQQGGWNVDAVLAWRTKGGAPQADTGSDPKPRMWVQARYAF